MVSEAAEELLEICLAHEYTDQMTEEPEGAEELLEIRLAPEYTDLMTEVAPDQGSGHDHDHIDQHGSHHNPHHAN